MRHLAGLWSKITDRIDYDGQHSDWKRMLLYLPKFNYLRQGLRCPGRLPLMPSEIRERFSEGGLSCIDDGRAGNALLSLDEIVSSYDTKTPGEMLCRSLREREK